MPGYKGTKWERSESQGKFQTVMWKAIYEMARQNVIDYKLSRKCSSNSRVSANGKSSWTKNCFLLR